jgi:hypothetical protein
VLAADAAAQHVMEDGARPERACIPPTATRPEISPDRLVVTVLTSWQAVELRLDVNRRVGKRNASPVSGDGKALIAPQSPTKYGLNV